MMFNAIFNDISVIYSGDHVCLSFYGRNQRPTSHWQTVSLNVVSSTPRREPDLKSHFVVVIGIGSCKSNVSIKNVELIDLNLVYTLNKQKLNKLIVARSWYFVDIQI